MQITQNSPDAHKLIRLYDTEGFEIGGIRYQGGIIVSRDLTNDWNFKDDPSSLRIEDFLSSHNLQNIDVLLVGTGKKFIMAPKDLSVELRTKGIGVEFMDTGAACRTYNVLVSEERNVAAALLPI